MSGLEALLTPTNVPCGSWLGAHVYSLASDTTVTTLYNNLPPIQTASPVTTPQTVNLHWSGSKILIPALTNAIVLQLPTVVGNAGLYFEFVMSGTAGFTATIKSYTANVQGVFSVGPSSGVLGVEAAASTNIILAATAKAGDWVSVWTDGTSWYAKGQSFVATGITVS